MRFSRNREPFVGNDKNWALNFSEGSVKEIGESNKVGQVLRCGISINGVGGVYIGEHNGVERQGRGSEFHENGVCFCGSFKNGLYHNGILLKEERYTFYKDGVLFRELVVKKKTYKCLRNLIQRVFFLVRTFSLSRGLSYSSLWANHSWNEYLINQGKRLFYLQLRDHGLSPAGSVNEGERCSVIPTNDDNYLRSDDLREEVAHTSSPEAIFACAGPVATEHFSVQSFSKGFFIFLFPFFALPGLCCSPCAIDSINTEREFIVSGASLQRSFDSPSLSLYVSSFALLCEVAAVVGFFIGHAKTNTWYNDHISIAEIFVSAFLWILNALIGGSYFGFRRSPHGLERMNRALTAELTALAANLVDSKSDICIYTWDETGRDKVKNKRYRLKWFLLSFLVACIHGGFTPVFRALMGFNVVGNHPVVILIIILMSISMACFVFVITYYALKGLDMQREQRSKLAVLTKIAYIERKSILAPGTYVKDHFCCDDVFNISDLKKGFPGWYTTRSLVLCASPCANHLSRGAAVSVVLFAVFLFGTIDISFHIYKNFYIQKKDYSYLLGYNLIVLFTWGPICVQYLVVCASVRFELLRHLYIMDVSGIFHRLRNNDTESSNIIHKCRDIAASHDTFPSFFNIPLLPFISWFLIIWFVLAMLLSFTTCILLLTGYV